MFKAGIDQDALIKQFSEASARQSSAVRGAVSDATLKALQGRELTLKNIKKVVNSVTEAASQGAQANPNPIADVEKLLDQAVAGVDAALLQTVEANRRALEQMIQRGVDLRDSHAKEAMKNLEKMEDMMFSTIKQAASKAPDNLQGPWTKILETMQIKGTGTGAFANTTIEQLTDQAQAAVRQSRDIGMKASAALMESYTAMVSGVLIGMSEGFSKATKAPAAPAAAPAPAAAKKRSK